ncbi:MAG: pyridoxamine 5'-phosphate oxidase family protein [Actinomycetota bacterium]|nr:pyridoxamine 5'-phosphate oxidase family protein [Actinomycetota bacterium]
MHDVTVVGSGEELREILGAPVKRVVEKVRPRLSAVHRDWIGASPFLVLATADTDGRCDASPKGDPAGFVHVLDDTTLVIPERPGNRRADGYLNILANPHIGLVFVIPGRPDTLRVNGSARVVKDAPWFEDLVVRGHRPVLALEVTVEEVFFHCGKAFMRSDLWKPETWTPEAVPSRARIAQQLERPDESIEDLEAYYGPRYAEGLY